MKDLFDQIDNLHPLYVVAIIIFYFLILILFYFVRGMVLKIKEIEKEFNEILENEENNSRKRSS